MDNDAWTAVIEAARNRPRDSDFEERAAKHPASAIERAAARAAFAEIKELSFRAEATAWGWPDELPEAVDRLHKLIAVERARLGLLIPAVL